MNIFSKKLIYLPLMIFLFACNASMSNEDTNISIKTTLGDIKIKLYDETPLHRDNFIKLITSNFYDGVSFHRIIKDFMIQAGDPATRSVPISGSTDTIKTYTIPAEFNVKYFHKKGALAAAREGNEVNPEMRSSGTQFYIVQGTRFSDEDLNMVEKRISSNIKQAIFSRLLRETSDSIRLSGKTISDSEIQAIASVKMFQYLTTNKDYIMPEDQRNAYKNAGGTPRLDGTYTVFGEVTEGMDIVDRIASVTTDNYDKPLKDVKILKIKIVSK